jgi:hypothetical protein
MKLNGLSQKSNIETLAPKSKKHNTKHTIDIFKVGPILVKGHFFIF